MRPKNPKKREALRLEGERANYVVRIDFEGEPARDIVGPLT